MASLFMRLLEVFWKAKVRQLACTVGAFTVMQTAAAAAAAVGEGHLVLNSSDLGGGSLHAEHSNFYAFVYRTSFNPAALRPISPPPPQVKTHIPTTYDYDACVAESCRGCGLTAEQGAVLRTFNDEGDIVMGIKYCSFNW